MLMVDIVLLDGGTSMGRLGLENGDLNIASTQQDYDIRLKGNDGGSIITALHLDMSEGGAATFAGDVSMAKLTATKSGTAAVFNSGTTNVVATFTSTDVYSWNNKKINAETKNTYPTTRRSPARDATRS